MYNEIIDKNTVFIMEGSIVLNKISKYSDKITELKHVIYNEDKLKLIIPIIKIIKEYYGQIHKLPVDNYYYLQESRCIITYEVLLYFLFLFTREIKEPTTQQKEK
jgi:hypothetical protein